MFVYHFRVPRLAGQHDELEGGRAGIWMDLVFFFFFSQVISLHIVNEKYPPGDSPLPGSEHQSTSACNSTLVCSFLQDPPGYFERFEIRQMLCHLLSISYPFLVTS